MHTVLPENRVRLARPSRWFREPVVHFIGLGALIFIAFNIWGGSGGDPRTAVSHSIHVTKDQITRINGDLRQNIGHAPSAGELTDAIDQWTKDEILHREGLAIGLDKNDPVIRARVVQLMKWYLVGLGGGGEPSETELRQRYEATEEKNRGANVVCFEQIFFSANRRGRTAPIDALNTLHSFAAGKQTGPEVAIGHGDTMGGDVAAEELQRGTIPQLQAKFGLPFVSSVQRLPYDKWSGPLESPVGWHVVRHLRPQNQTFEELRPQLRAELIVERGNGTPDASYAEIKRGYTIDIDALPPEVRK